MSTTDPFAMVEPDSYAQKGLRALGWTVTDTQDGWDHMEPPPGPPLLLREDEDLFEPPPEENETKHHSIQLRELNVGPNDLLVATAEDLPPKDLDKLRELIVQGLREPDFPIAANFDIVLTVVRTQGGEANQVR